MLCRKKKEKREQDVGKLTDLCDGILKGITNMSPVFFVFGRRKNNSTGKLQLLKVKDDNVLGEGRHFCKHYAEGNSIRVV